MGRGGKKIPWRWGWDGNSHHPGAPLHEGHKGQEPVTLAVPGVRAGQGGGEPMAAAPLFQLAESPSLKTVSLTFSIQVSELKCRYEQFFLLQRSQTAGRGVGRNPPAFLFLPRQNEREGDMQNQTRRHRHCSSRALANPKHPVPSPWPVLFLQA